jgi:multisubunit Na+/H+ antiporter MnhB subunit
MGLIETSAGLAFSLAVLAVVIVLDRRPYRPGKRNLVLLMIVALAASLLLARHLLTLIL